MLQDATHGGEVRDLPIADAKKHQVWGQNAGPLRHKHTVRTAAKSGPSQSTACHSPHVPQSQTSARIHGSESS